MKSQTLRRLMRAIVARNNDDLDRLAFQIVRDEKRLGHNRIAEELNKILRSEQTAGSTDSSLVEPGNSEGIEQGLTELPKSRRYRDPLATIVPREQLEHHMVLQPNVEKRFERIEKEFAARQRLANHGMAPRKKVLLYGPPGCGKTLGAKRLAWNLGLPLMKVRFDSLVSSYFGESSANLRSVFDASAANPCVLLLDECDFVARSRHQYQDIGEASRIVNTMLLLLDEYDSPGLFVATTNVEDKLDAAIFRRFDDAFEVTPPTRDEIQRLLEYSLSSMDVDNNVNWLELSETLRGFSAARVVKLARDAAKLAILENRESVSRKDFESAYADNSIEFP
ncbi:MAG: ATP-binding protein [Planctomycetota bacterium]